MVRVLFVVLLKADLLVKSINTDISALHIDCKTNSFEYPFIYDSVLSRKHIPFPGRWKYFQESIKFIVKQFSNYLELNYFEKFSFVF